MKLLVVDDSSTMRHIIKNTLRVTDGLELVKKVRIEDCRVWINNCIVKMSTAVMGTTK